MEFKIGQIVNFSGANYVVLDAQKHMINGRETTILGIRNIVTNDRISVNSEQVRLVDLNSTKSSSVNNSFDDFEASANDAESDLIENKTDYLNSLFSSISNENTEEFFNIDNTNEISEEKVERILEPTGESGFKKSSVTEDLVENFILPRSTIIQPRRHRNVLSQSDAVNETFADLNVAGVLPTTEYVRNDVEHIHEPVQMIQPRRDHTHEQRIKEPDAFAFVPKKETTKTDFSDFASIKSQPQKVQPQPITLDEDITRLIKEDATDVGTIIEPGFSESSEDDLTITSETKKIILEGLNDKASKFKEKQREILATGPINPTKLMSHLENGNNIGSSILDEITSDAINENDDVTSAQLLGTSENPKDIINNSKIYGSFRRMSAWFITLVVLLVFVPVIGIVVKIAGNFADDIANPMALSHIFSYSLDINSSSIEVLTSFISTILVLIATPILLLTTLIYGTIYTVVTMKRQYRRLAFFNYQMQKESGAIEALQDFSNESSVFMLKLNNENKEVKKQMKKIIKLSGMNIVKNISQDSKKEVH